MKNEILKAFPKTIAALEAGLEALPMSACARLDNELHRVLLGKFAGSMRQQRATGVVRKSMGRHTGGGGRR